MVSAHPRMLDPVPIAAMLLHAIVRARRKHGGEQGHPEEAERRKRKGTEAAGSKEEDLLWGSAAARPTLTTGLVYGGPQVRDRRYRK